MSTIQGAKHVALRIYVNKEFEKTNAFDPAKDVWKLVELLPDEINLDTLRTTIEHHSFLQVPWVNNLLINNEYSWKLSSFDCPEIEIEDDDALHDEIETFVDLETDDEDNVVDDNTPCKLRMYFIYQFTAVDADEKSEASVSGETSDDEIKTQNNITDLQVARLQHVDMECSCNFKLGQHKLYFCDKCDSDVIYCDDCGPFLHRPAAGKNHKWADDIIEIPIINANNYQNGESEIIKLLGAERYKNIIAPKIRALATNVFTVSNAMTVFTGSKMISASYNLGIASTNASSAAYEFGQTALKAQSAAKEVTTRAAQALNAANEATEAVLHAKEMAEVYTVGSSNNPFYFLYNWIYKEKAENARTIYQEAVAARDWTQKKAAEYADASLQAREIAESANHKAQVAKQLAESKASQATASASAAKDSMKLTNTLKSAAYVTAGLTVIEMFIHGYKYGKKEISLHEFCRLSGKSLSRNTASMIGTTLGSQVGLLTASQLGSQFGESICPGFGTLAGAGVGLISGMILSWTFGKIAENMYEKLFPCEEEKIRKEQIHEALIYFRLTEQDIDNPKVFNEQRIRKEYRNAALSAHPDRNNGDCTKWNILSTYYGILIGLLDQPNKNKKIVKNTVIQSLQ